jgi:hypothetical protein
LRYPNSRSRLLPLVVRTTKRASTSVEALRSTGPDDYFSEVLTDVNIVLSVVPSPFTTAMMARLIPAAIKAYSIAVAADSSAENRANKSFIPHLLVEQHRISTGSPKWNLNLKR